MTAVFDTNDDLLAHVTAFGVTDRVVEVCFEDHVRFIHVLTVTWNAGFDSQYLERFRTHSLRPGGNQFLINCDTFARVEQ